MRKLQLRAFFAAAGLLTLALLAHAEEVEFVDFGGERFVLAFEDQQRTPEGERGEAVAEFSRPGESADHWSKRFAFHAYPQTIDDPAAAAEALGQQIVAQNKDARYAVAVDEAKGEAIIDYLTWPPDSELMEFNVVRYAPAPDGRGLIALQYSEQVSPEAIGVAGMRQLRQRTVEEMARADMARAVRYFAQRQRYSESNREEVEEPDGTHASLDQ